MTSSALILITLMNSSWDDMEICPEFLPDWSRNVEGTDQNALCPWVRYDCHWANFYWSHANMTTFCRELLFQNLWKFDRGLVADTGHILWAG